MKIRLVTKKKISVIEMTKPIEIITSFNKTTVTQNTKNICFSDYAMIITSPDLEMNKVVCFNALIIIENEIIHFINLSSQAPFNNDFIYKFNSNKNRKIDQLKSLKNQISTATTEYQLAQTNTIQSKEISKFFAKSKSKYIIKEKLANKKLEEGGKNNV